MNRFTLLLTSLARQTRSISRAAPNGRPSRQRLGLERLDERCLPSTSPLSVGADQVPLPAVDSSTIFSHRHPSITSDAAPVPQTYTVRFFNN
jgi:hypothetical protein